jgi:hypothetical protein
VVVAEEPSGTAQPRLHLDNYQQCLVGAAQPLQANPVLPLGGVDPLALNGFHHECRDVALAQQRLGSIQIPNGTRTAPGNSGPKPSRNSLPPLSDSAPVVRPWKACSAYTIRVRLVWCRANSGGSGGTGTTVKRAALPPT